MLDPVHISAAQTPHIHTQNRFSVIPTPDKLSADSSFTGRGIRIAFLDSGFYPHPDFIDRVIHFHDVSGEEKSLHPAMEPSGHHWHGTQTVVSCAGSGSLSDGVFKGIASDAELVLVKVSKAGSISDRSIEKGLEWVLANHKSFGIRVLNISLGGDCDRTTSESAINQLAEELVWRGVVITVAAGNSSDRRPIPPAAAPSVITVGGYSDENRFGDHRLYHSTFGVTADGVLKPEVIAPAMYVAAPILPGTEDYKAAELLSMLAATPDYALSPMIEEYWKECGLDADVLNADPDNARKIIDYALHRRKVIGTHYQHVDGTSFAAPITASVAAQMLEANPSLSPTAVKDILISTASRIASEPSIRQGYGVLNAPEAVRRAIDETHGLEHTGPREVGGRVHFYFHDDSAASVSISGDFGWWRQHPLSKRDDGIWECSIPKPVSGRYRYKFLVNGDRWKEDPSHGLKVEDEFGGFNSVLIVH